MTDHNRYEISPVVGDRRPDLVDEVILTVVPEPTPEPPPPPQPARRRLGLPLLLFLATCGSTYFVGGPVYALCVMTILVCHEAGHFIQSWRYGVYSSLPYFIPLPIPPLGTMGAVIGMSASIPNRRALFDIGVSGPLAGLVPTLVFCVLGLMWSEPAAMVQLNRGEHMVLGRPLLMDVIINLVQPPNPQGMPIQLHPMAMAGWVGLFITALNLFPIGQLDGGHVLYALLRRKANFVASFLLFSAVALVVLYSYYSWTLMLVLLMLMGPNHPPTGDDSTRLGLGRSILGWLTLAFLPLGFTPIPFR